MPLLEKNHASKISKMPSYPVGKKGVTTRSKTQVANKGENADPISKRKAEASPPKGRLTKRSAFTDLTNKAEKDLESKGVKGKDSKVASKHVEKNIQISANSVLKEIQIPTNVKEAPVKEVDKKSGITKASLRSSTSRRQSTLEKSSDLSLYESAVELLSEDTDTGKNKKSKSLDKIIELPKSEVTVKPVNDPKTEETEVKGTKREKYVLPEGVTDFDSENLHDPFQVSVYAMDIFDYLKQRENRYVCKDYMKHQASIDEDMRALLVDWMVEVQETFELNHETLYLAVKMVDLYLGHISIRKTLLQLVGATAMFIACKYDERVPPSIDDFHYICAEEYKVTDILAMEINMIKTLKFDLGMPLSYRFLRRYSRCAKVQMPLLTLARYILELSLMQYACIKFSESKLAAASLYLALKMKKISGWTSTLEYYSGYQVNDFKNIVLFLNKMLHDKPKATTSTIRNKYSHKVFFEVAKTELLKDEDLDL